MVNRLTGEIQSTMIKAWFLPKLFAIDEQSLLTNIEGKFGIEAKTLDELRDRSDFAALLFSPYPVHWVQGWLGYFWWELYQDLKNAVPLRFCKQCGNILAG